MAEFVNKVTLQGQLGDYSTYKLTTDDSCVCFVLYVEDSRIDCFTTKRSDPDFFLLCATGKAQTGDWIRLEGFLHVVPDFSNKVVCTTVAVLPE